MSGHPDPEALSAYHDGEAPELAGHVEGCAACRADLARLATVSQALAGAADPMSPAAIDGMIGRAIGNGGTEAEGTDVAPRAEVPRALPRQPAPRRWAAVASIAAVALLAVGVGGLLATADRGGSSATRTAAPGPTASDKRAASPPAAAGITDDAPIDGGDLGDVVDARALARDVEPTLRARDAATGTDNPVLAAPSDTDASRSGQAGEASRAPRVVGTRACELEARAIDPASGPLVYVATATHDGAAATVLGFGPPGSQRPVSLFLMAQNGCGLLARATLP